jgi:hypothetical protein
VRDCREEQPPGTGPLAMSVAVDSAGGFRLVAAGELAAVRVGGGIAQAFQSYPALLLGDGAVPRHARIPPGTGSTWRTATRGSPLGLLRNGKILIGVAPGAACRLGWSPGAVKQHSGALWPETSDIKLRVLNFK